MNNIDPFKKTPNRIGELIDLSSKSLREISQEIDINYETLSAYKRQVRYPKKENAEKLADYFGVSVPYLLGIDDDPKLHNPSNESLLHSLYKHITQGTNISNKINDWTPFKNDAAILLADFKNTNILEDYIDFVAKDKDYNPIILKAFKQFISDKVGAFPYMLNKSGDENSPFYYVWQAWEKAPEHIERVKENTERIKREGIPIFKDRED